MPEFIENLKKLHTALIDSREGYAEALEDAGPKGLTDLFHQMIDLRTRHHLELDEVLREAGEKPDESSSFMSSVHRTVIKVRSLLTGLDESILPGLIDGEKRILGYYQDAERSEPPAAALRVLLRQRQSLEAAIEMMEQRKGPWFQT